MDTATARAEPRPILTGTCGAGGSGLLATVAGPSSLLEAGVLACSSTEGELDGSGALYDGLGALGDGSGALWPLEPVLLECSPPVEAAGF